MHALAVLCTLVAEPYVSDANAPTAAASAPVDLLHRTGAQIGVSSEVENPTDMPDALVDGDIGKAWQSRTGDLKGAWVAFRLAPDARIARIGIVPGVGKKTDTLALFTANQRLTKVRLTEYDSGKLVGDYALDPSKPELQYLPLDLSGGAYKLTVTGVLAGSKKAWRELPIGEFTVEGTPGSDVPGPVSVYVGPLGVRTHLTELLAPFGALPPGTCPAAYSLGEPHQDCTASAKVEWEGMASTGACKRLIHVQVTGSSLSAPTEKTLVRTAKNWFAVPDVETLLDGFACNSGQHVVQVEWRFVGPYLLAPTPGDILDRIGIFRRVRRAHRRSFDVLHAQGEHACVSLERRNARVQTVRNGNRDPTQARSRD